MKRNFEYILCNWCLERQFIKKYRQNDSKDCQICHRLDRRIDGICSKIIQETKDYQYETCQIGLTLHHIFYENEDNFRSRFKIRGKESIKTNLLREIRKRYTESSNKKIDFDSPDITINLIIQKNFEIIVSIISRTLFLYGRYVKRKRFHTAGKYSQIVDSMEENRHHVENLLKKKLSHVYKSDSIVFWPLGKEEAKSLVLGKGRPFYVSIKNPKIISFPHRYSVQCNGVTFYLKEKLARLPVHQPYYVKKVKTLISISGKPTPSDLKLVDNSGIILVEFVNNKNKSWQFAYKMKSKLKKRSKLELTILCDNGFQMRKFIDGSERTFPNLYDIIQKKCNCDRYDIVDIFGEDDLLS